MNKLHRGAAGLTLLLVVLVLGLGAAAGFAGISYVNLRNNVELEQQAAVSEAREVQKAEDEAAERARTESEKRSITLSPVFGSIKVTFPKPWNIFIFEDEGGDNQADITIHPDLIRSVNGKTVLKAFRLRLENKIYSEAVKGYDNAIKKGDVSAQTVTVSGIAGTRFNGKIAKEYEGTLIMVPLRDKTVVVWNEDPEYRDQFETILAELDLTP